MKYLLILSILMLGLSASARPRCDIKTANGSCYVCMHEVRRTGPVVTCIQETAIEALSPAPLPAVGTLVMLTTTTIRVMETQTEIFECIDLCPPGTR
jgi:hypothetical protein